LRALRVESGSDFAAGWGAECVAALVGGDLSARRYFACEPA
jgi:hypothetical protein